MFGNFLTLTRRGLQDGGSYGLIDDLTFTLTGNQVTKIEDAATDPTYYGVFNFNDGASQSNEYTYDKNGNMTKDLNKNISSIQYNSLNLPSKVVFSNGKYMDYVYSATGEKRSVTYNVLSSGGNYTYCDNFIYYNGSLNKILVDGGYISISGTTPTYHYYLKDHLGNNRVVVNASGTVKQVTHYYPFGGFFGESTGGSYQTYKYNGKEFERLISEDWYDYGARHMSPNFGRFTTMDPMAEKYYSISPYAYCGNNPVNAIDQDGREVIDMLPAQSKRQQISEQNFFNRWHDNKNSIILMGHGIYSGKSFRTEGAPFTINANSYYSMASFLEDNSQTWNISSIASDKVELVLFSCETGSYDGLAQNLSKQNDFQNISIVPFITGIQTKWDYLNVSISGFFASKTAKPNW